jgi:hypothetical protein
MQYACKRIKKYDTSSHRMPCALRGCRRERMLHIDRKNNVWYCGIRVLLVKEKYRYLRSRAKKETEPILLLDDTAI